MVSKIPVRKFDDRAMLMSLLGSLRGQGYSLNNIESKLSRIAPLDRELLEDCLAEIGVEPPVHVIVADLARERIARFVR